MHSSLLSIHIRKLTAISNYQVFQKKIKKKKKSQQYIHKEILSAHYDGMKFI